MITRLTAALILVTVPGITAQEPRQDMLRFTNGDQLRGRFDGIREGPLVKWLHDGLTSPAEFKISSLHQLILHEGQPRQPMRTLSHVELANQDRFPGTLVSLDENKITLDTEYAGIIHIPRSHLSILAPNPMGGRLYYHGPFAEDEWELIHAKTDTPPSSEDDTASEETPEDAEKWLFTGSSWLWKGKNPTSALARSSGVPSHSVIRFDLAWKNRLSLAIALHADFHRPPVDEENPRHRQRSFNTMDPYTLARIFGNSHILQLYSNYLAHTTTHVDENGEISVSRGVRGNHNVRLGDAGKARIELRSNRITGEVTLFIDDGFTAQWNGRDNIDDADQPAFTGSGLGFIVMGNESPVRISDIVISEWNGMPDSARSLQIEDQDIVLMTNGTDRYAGKVGGLAEDRMVHFEGRHGNFKLPLEEIAEIRFARNSLATIPEDDASGILVRMGPIGAISGSPHGGDRNALDLVNPSVGKIHLTLDPVTLIDFNPSHIPIDDWNHDF